MSHGVVPPLSIIIASMFACWAMSLDRMYLVLAYSGRVGAGLDATRLANYFFRVTTWPELVLK